MKITFLKQIHLFILISLFYSILGMAMNNDNLTDDIIINQLKIQGIKPHVTYIHSDYPYTDYKNFPTQPFLTLTEAERKISYFSDNEIQFIELNNNYQYEKILFNKRDVIDILFPIAMFSEYSDGEHFFTLDEKYQLHHLNSVEEAWKQDCYLKIVIEKGKVVKMQKRPLTWIQKSYFSYWANGNKQKEISEQLDLNNSVKVRYEIEYDQTGQRIKLLEDNFITNYKVVMTYLYTQDVYALMDIFNEKGIKVNHTIFYDELGNVENQYLDESGQIIHTSNIEPNLSTDVYLPQSAIYQSIPMDLLRVHPSYVDKLIEQMASKDNYTLADQEAVTRAKFLGIQSNSTYYHPTPFPQWAKDRYKNYPHQLTMTLAQAEYQHPKEQYVDLVKVTVGDNYQYQTISREKWLQVPLSIPHEQFKPLENGTYFFTLDKQGQLIPLEDIEQAIILPSYVRIEKVMGKIASILQKTRIQKTQQVYEYNENNQMHKEILTVLESPSMPLLTVETIYDDIGVFVVSQTIKDSQNKRIAVFSKFNDNNIYGVIERFNREEEKTNHITIYRNTLIENRHLDKAGNTLLITDDLTNENDPQPYDELPLYSDKLIQQIFNAYLNKNKE
ncbi:hypothetical protein FPB0191_00600 [Frischella perrara]|uniref:Uncharacterized protein n=4 Tax=Frischella perrara TaxID=1267021 RepID=A0A0A7S5B2_FRIPE|nr:hypothetical protein [Frischella perrara]AJA44431.1 hypothetical protein FPB0191_00600 [Frischella perrara]